MSMFIVFLAYHRIQTSWYITISELKSTASTLLRLMFIIVCDVGFHNSLEYSYVTFGTGSVLGFLEIFKNFHVWLQITPINQMPGES